MSQKGSSQNIRITRARQEHKHLDSCLKQHQSFTPFVFSTTKLIRREAQAFLYASLPKLQANDKMLGWALPWCAQRISVCMEARFQPIELNFIIIHGRIALVWTSSTDTIVISKNNCAATQHPDRRSMGVALPLQLSSHNFEDRGGIRRAIRMHQNKIPRPSTRNLTRVPPTGADTPKLYNRSIK